MEGMAAGWREIVDVLALRNDESLAHVYRVELTYVKNITHPTPILQPQRTYIYLRNSLDPKDQEARVGLSFIICMKPVDIKQIPDSEILMSPKDSTT